LIQILAGSRHSAKIATSVAEGIKIRVLKMSPVRIQKMDCINNNTWQKIGEITIQNGLGFGK
tara:strand:- start:112 stop:297 length:186 start_codon:yes stop_codon:yes gene_type:complete